MVSIRELGVAPLQSAQQSSRVPINHGYRRHQHVTWIYEALSHSRRAHRSYLAIYTKNQLDDPAAKNRLERLKMNAHEQESGLLYSTTIWIAYETLLENSRANFADLSEVNDFIATEIVEKDKIIKWLM